MFNNHLLIILFLPLGAFVYLSLFGRFVGRKGAMFIGPFCIGLSVCFSGVAFLKHAITGDFAYLLLGT